MKPLPVLVLSLGLMLPSLHADVRLPAIISDHMVLERTAKVPIWGWADPGEAVTVTLDGQAVKTVAGADGAWRVELNLEKSAQGPFELTVAGNNKLTVADVVVGEVWVASGQSNMNWRLKDSANAGEIIAKSANPLLREFAVKPKTSMTPLSDTEGKWVLTAPENSRHFSAVGYFFGRSLQQALNAPVGIIHTSWGGTPSEAWTSVPAMDSIPAYKASRERLWKIAEEYPGKKKAFGAQMTEWAAKNNRTEPAVGDVAAYAGQDADATGWSTIKLPGKVAGADLPAAGVVWIRKEFDVPNKTSLALNLPIEGFDSVYFNGQLIKKTSYQDYPGQGYVRRWEAFTIPDSAVQPGKNVIAIRLYEPVGPAEFTAEPKAGNISLAGEWLAKAETSFPTLDPQALASAPKPPNYFSGPQFISSTLFNGMINPIIPYAIKGAIWYQGESNVGRAYQYRTALPLLINDWRRAWGQGEFPFYIVQLANFLPKKNVPGESAWAELREAQAITAATVPKVGQAVIIDIGESADIHPLNKKDVGERLALLALERDYAQNVVSAGPTFKSAEFKDGKAILTFVESSSRLVARPVPATYDVRMSSKETAPLVRNSPQSDLEGFTICGSDKKWGWANAKIEGDKVVVWSESVREPVAFRYGWSDNPTVNLYNEAGLPASPFRSDDYVLTTKNVGP